MTNNTPFLPRPKAPLLDFTKDSRAIDKILESLDDIIADYLEFDVEDAGEPDSQRWDEAVDHFHGLIAERLSK